MTSFLLSADIPYADIAFFVVVALGLILGVIRGFSKSFKGVFLTIAIMLSALLLITPTFDSVRNLDMFKNMESSITEKIESGDKIFSQKIFISTDSETGEKKYYVEVSGEEGTSKVELENSMGDGLTSSLKGKFALWLAKTFITDDGQSVGGVAGAFVSDIIVAVIMFVVYCVALGRVLFGTVARVLASSQDICQNAHVRIGRAESDRPHFRRNRVDGVRAGVYPRRACDTQHAQRQTADGGRGSLFLDCLRIFLSKQSCGKTFHRNFRLINLVSALCRHV